MKLPLLVRSRHGDEYGPQFMQLMTDSYMNMTPHTKMRLDNVALLVDPRPGDRVLDLGCATGAMAHFLSTFGCKVAGADASAVGIEEARKLFPDIRFEVADAARLPFTDGEFDKILAADLTEHLDETTLAGMFVECFRVLAPGGTLSIHTPNPNHLIERMKDHELLIQQNPTHIGLLSSDALSERLRKVGFEIDLDVKRRSFIPVFRTLELLGSPFTELLRYRICLRARKPVQDAE